MKQVNAISNEVLPGFANKLGAHSIGGILLCGMNWGDGGGKKEEPKPIQLDNQNTYFSSRENRYPYQNRIIKWFEYWGFKMDPDNPTDLDLAISQTNLFLDSSRNFNDVIRRPEDSAEALERFSRAVEIIRPAAILFLSISTLQETVLHAKNFNCPNFERVIGFPSLNKPRRFYDPNEQKKFFDVLLSEGKNISLAAIPHPTAPFFYRYKSEGAAARAAEVMTPWLEKALTDYKDTQKRLAA